MNRSLAILLCCIALNAGLPAVADEPAASPRWSFEFKGGRFHPQQPDWKRYYGSDSMNHFAIALGYMPLRALELGAELGYAYDKGQGLLPSSGALGGEVGYTLVPAHVYLIVRGAFTEGQWVIPYAGGGWSRVSYRQEVARQQDHKGHADGWNARAGLQLLLNDLDPRHQWRKTGRQELSARGEGRVLARLRALPRCKASIAGFVMPVPVWHLLPCWRSVERKRRRRQTPLIPVYLHTPAEFQSIIKLLQYFVSADETAASMIPLALRSRNCRFFLQLRGNCIRKI
jgi:hypothetical protein